MKKIILVVLFVFVVFPAFAKKKEMPVHVQLGWYQDGAMSEAWLKAIEPRYSERDFERLKKKKALLEEPQKLWMNLVYEILPVWKGEIPTLVKPFKKMQPALPLTVMFGNQGGSDAFTCGENTICFDLGAWVANYGAPEGMESVALVHRLLSHEYTHLLLHKWAETHPYTSDSPYEKVLWTLYNEGIAHYYSLSEKWAGPKGDLTGNAKYALHQLKPILTERLAKIKTADEKELPGLLKGMCTGPFDQKWGCLPVALWIAKDSKGSVKKLQEFVEKGPLGVEVLIKNNTVGVEGAKGDE